MCRRMRYAAALMLRDAMMPRRYALRFSRRLRIAYAAAAIRRHADLAAYNRRCRVPELRTQAAA